MPLCGPHDRWKHANHIRSRRATGGRLFLITPDGTTILPAGAREPEWAEPPPTATNHQPTQPHPNAPHLYWFDGQDSHQYQER